MKREYYVIQIWRTGKWRTVAELRKSGDGLVYAKKRCAEIQKYQKARVALVSYTTPVITEEEV